MLLFSGPSYCAASGQSVDQIGFNTGTVPCSFFLLYGLKQAITEPVLQLRAQVISAAAVLFFYLHLISGYYPSPCRSQDRNCECFGHLAPWFAVTMIES